MRVKGKSKILTAFIALLVTLIFGTSFFVGCSGETINVEQVFLLDKTVVDMTVDSTEMLTLNIVNIDEAPVWASSDTSVATVTVGSSANRATVRGVGEGAALITATADGNTVVCAVTVKPGIYVNVEKETIYLWKGLTETITVDTNYTGTVTYSSNNTSVATVSDSGLISAVSGGKATITVTAGNKTATVTVNVTEPIVTLNKTLLQLMTDDGENTAQLTATADGKVEWHSENPEIATVDDDGLVTAVSQGETVVSATFMSGSATCVVKVKSEILSVTIKNSSVTLDDDNLSETLSATVSSNKRGDLTGNEAKVTWSVVSGGSLVSVTPDGVVTWKKGYKNYGTATVRATSVTDPDATADCTINCPDPYGDWIAISDKASLNAALSAGNEFKNMYLTADIDLGGAALNGFAGTFSGTFDGMGFTISNYHGFLCHNLSGTIKNLHVVCTTEGLQNSFGAFTHHVNGNGVIKDCLIDVTYVEDVTGGIACFSQGAVSNIIIFARNEKPVGQAYAAMVQGGTFENVYYVAYGNILPGGAAAKTEDEIKSADTFDETWEAGWVIIDGELPQIKNVNVQEPIKVTVDKATAEIYVGENITITATVTPYNLPDDEREVTWTTSDATVATVDEDGVVTAIKAGNVTITATSKTDDTKYAECAITVKAIELAINPEDIITALKIGGTKQLHAIVNRGDVTWKSSDNSIATISADGLITAVKAGNVTITATSTLDSAVTATMTFEVSAAVNITVTLDKTELDLDRGATAKLNVTVGNSDAGVNWESSDDTIATVDENGVVTTYSKDGTATITVTSKEDGGNGYVSATCEITVAYVKEVITVEQTELLIPTNSAVTLAEIASASKGTLELSLKSGSASGVVTIQNNKLTAVGAGTVTVLLTWSIDYADIEDQVTEIEVEVYEPAVALSIDTAKRTLKVGESSAANMLHVTMDVMPSEPDADDITWTSSNPNVISTIDAGYSDGAYTGTLNAATEGYTVITATYTVGKIEYKASCEIVVFASDGVLTAVYDLTTFATAMGQGGNYYLAHDLDLNGATVDTHNRGGYTGKFNGHGFTVSNFTTSAFFMYPDNGCVIENIKLVCTLSGNAGNEGILGHHIIGGTIRNCYFDVTFGTNLAGVTPALANHIAGGTLENLIVVTHNPNGGNVFADFCQGDGAVKNMFSCRIEGNINNPQKGTAITEAQLKSATTYSDKSWADNWVMTDGYVPELLLAGFPQAHRHTFATEWMTDETNHWHAATCEHETEVDGLGAHNTDGRDGECTVCDYLPEGTHRHTYSDTYSHDETHHWIATTCEDHGEVQIDRAEHNALALGNGCSVCGYSTAEEYDLEYSGENNMPTDVWVYWSNAGNFGGTSNGSSLTVTFTENNDPWYGRQLFYKDSAIANQAAAKISMTITSTVSGHITVNGQVIELKANVPYKFSGNGAGGNAIISIQMGVSAGNLTDISAATIAFTGITITP